MPLKLALFLSLFRSNIRNIESVENFWPLAPPLLNAKDVRIFGCRALWITPYYKVYNIYNFCQVDN